MTAEEDFDGDRDCLSWEEIEDLFDEDYDDFWDHYDDDDDEEDNNNNNDSNKPSAALIIFLVFLFIVVIASIIACVVCFYCSVKARPTRTTSSLRSPMGQQGMTPVGVTTTNTGAFALPAYDQPTDPEKQMPQNFVSAPEYPVSPPPTYTTPHA